MRTFTVAALIGVLVLGLAGSAHADTTLDRKARVVLTGGLTVRADERSDAIVVFDGPVRIDGTVNGAVVVFHGNVTVTGTIQDDLMVFSGKVRIDEGANIGGDVVTNQAPVIASGATVGGEVRRIRGDFSFGFLGRFVVWVAYSVSVLLLGLFLVLIAPRGLDAVAVTGRERVGPAIGWGFLLFFGLPIASIILLVTLVGIPLGFALLLALFLLFTVGYTSSVWFVGRLIMGLQRGRVVSFLIGWLILRGIGLIPVAGGLVWFAAAVFGLGLLLVAAWRARSEPVPAVIQPASLTPQWGSPLPPPSVPPPPQ